LSPLKIEEVAVSCVNISNDPADSCDIVLKVSSFSSFFSTLCLVHTSQSSGIGWIVCSITLGLSITNGAVLGTFPSLKHALPINVASFKCSLIALLVFASLNSGVDNSTAERKPELFFLTSGLFLDICFWQKRVGDNVLSIPTGFTPAEQKVKVPVFLTFAALSLLARILPDASLVGSLVFVRLDRMLILTKFCVLWEVSGFRHSELVFFSVILPEFVWMALLIASLTAALEDLRMLITDCGVSRTVGLIIASIGVMLELTLNLRGPLIGGGIC